MKKGINNKGFKALPSSVQTNILSNMRYGGNTFAAGGAMPMEQLTEFNEGGRHEENGLGGIPQGMNPEGQMNLVEEGETKFDAENYIYSDSLKVDKELSEAFNLNPKMVGKTFADASKMAGRKKSKREGDAIEEAANNADLENLMQAQEAFKQARIEEKLQEIAELDPNALPALMGQGQPQGDPAMGGQMQEAPMDEQAMMEQQMMAEQQAGGGQPSPEEMAMMQQQQDMAMGQQEGMMRNGGYATRSMRLGGPKDPSYSKDYTADNYKPIDRYGQTNSPRTYEADKIIAGNLGINGPLTKEDTNFLNHVADSQINNYDNFYRPEIIDDYSDGEVIIPRFSNPGMFPMTEDGYTGPGYFERFDKDGNDIRAKARIEDIKKEKAFNDKIKKEGFLETMGGSYNKPSSENILYRPEARQLLDQQNMQARARARIDEMDVNENRYNSNAYPESNVTRATAEEAEMNSGGFLYGNGGYTRSYAPGGFMGMNMANAGMMTPGPCGTPGNPPCPGTKAEVAKITMDRMEDRSAQDQSASTIGGLAFSPHLSYDEEEGFEENRVLQDLRKNMLSTYGASATDSDPAYGSGTGIGEFPGKERTGKFKEFVGKVKDDFVDKRENIKAFRQKPNTAGRRYTKVNRGLNLLRAKDDRIRNTGNQYFAVKHPRATEDAEGNNLRALSNLYLGVRDKSKFVGRFGEGTIGQSGPRFRRNEFGGNLMQSGQEAGINPMQGMNQAFNMGGMLDGGFQGQGIDVMQGLGSQMRRGGKMCYGCGGAMHNYGGRMNGMNQMATGGEIISGIGSGLYGVGEGLLDTLTFGLTDELTDKGYEALQEIGPMKGEDNVGDAIRGGANVAGAATGAVLTGGAATGSAVAQGSKGTGDMLGAIGEETGNETLGKVGKGVEGAGQVAGMFIGGGGAGSAAGKAAGSAGSVAAGAGTLGAGANIADAASKAADAAKVAKFAKVGEIASNKGVQAGVNMASTAIGSSEEKAEAERLAEEERMRIEREMMMTNDPTSPYYNATIARYGKKLYGKGGGLWANIQAKKERMGSNYRPAKPGDKDYPTNKAIKAAQNAMGGRLYYPGGYLFGSAGEVPEQTNTDNEFNNMYPDISEALEESIPQKIAMYAPIAKNLYDATLAKSDDYTPDFVPAEFVQLDPAQAIQQAKQSNAGIVNAARAKGFNNPSTMLALNQQLQGTVANVQAQYDQVNAKLKQAKLDKDNAQKTELSKIKEELAMRLKEAKNLAANEALKQAKQIAENKTANKLAALYATMGAPDMGKNFMGTKKMTKAQLDRAIKKLEEERKKL